MTRYRIVEVAYHLTHYIIEKKGMFFWSPLLDYEGDINTFYNLELAEAHLGRLLVVPKRTIVKEINTEKTV